jgi:chromosome segregation ATPase
VTAKRTPADVLREARKQDSLTKRTRVLAVVDDMKANGEAMTFLAVARKAGVSNWLVYAEGVREHIEAARKTQAGTAARESKAGSRVSDASLAVDLELTRTALRRVRDERDRLKVKVQRGLGQQIDQAGNADQERRIRELGDKLQQRDAALAEVRAERNGLQEKLSEAEDTVGALRRSLKQMMRDQGTLSGQRGAMS